MDSRLLIEIYRQPTGELAAKFKHLQGDEKADEEFTFVSGRPISLGKPEDLMDASQRRHDTINFFQNLKTTAQDRLFPEYSNGITR